MADLYTARQNRVAIRKARAVMVQARFGTSKAWVRVRKADALDLMRRCTDPDDDGMSSGTYGTIENDGTVYLG